MENPKYRVVKVYDYTEYDPARCNNGGAYGFWTEYRPVGHDSYAVGHYTTAEFDYCSACGSFGNCLCGGEPEVITEAELEKIIREVNKNASPDYYVEVEGWSLDLGKLRRRCEDALRKNRRLSTLLAVASELGVEF